jgi:hypothetical protein
MLSSDACLRSHVGLWIVLGLAVAASAVSTPFACAGSGPCQRNSDCDNAYCSNGECKKDCVVADLDCPPGYLCDETARCRAPDGGLPDGAAGKGGAGEQGGSGGSGNGGSNQGGTGQGGTSVGGGSQGGSGGSTGVLKEFDTCGADGDCTSGLVCKPMLINGGKRCTRPCNSSAQCMTGTRCGKDGFCTFDDDGAVCNGNGQCNVLCVAGPGANYCTSECGSGADCPNGWGCSQPIGGTRVCLRLDVDCAQATDCAGQVCDNQNLVVSGCTIPCTSAQDCPQRGGNLPPWSCSGGFCIRPGDIFGPVSKDQVTQWACNGNGVASNMCADGITLDAAPSLTCSETQTVSTSGLCMSTCRFTGGCGWGFACVGGLAQVGGVVTPICMRTGFAEVGQACSGNEKCMFGLCDGGKCSRDCSQDNVCPHGFQCSSGKCL